MKNLRFVHGFVEQSRGLKKVEFGGHDDFESFVACCDGACIDARATTSRRLKNENAEHCAQIVFRREGVEIIRTIGFIVFRVDSRPWPQDYQYITHFVVDGRVVYFYNPDCTLIEANVNLNEGCLIAFFDKHIATKETLEQIAMRAVTSEEWEPEHKQRSVSDISYYRRNSGLDLLLSQKSSWMCTNTSTECISQSEAKYISEWVNGYYTLLVSTYKHSDNDDAKEIESVLKYEDNFSIIYYNGLDDYLRIYGDIDTHNNFFDKSESEMQKRKELDDFFFGLLNDCEQ